MVDDNQLVIGLVAKEKELDEKLESSDKFADNGEHIAYDLVQIAQRTPWKSQKMF